MFQTLSISQSYSSYTSRVTRCRLASTACSRLLPLRMHGPVSSASIGRLNPSVPFKRPQFRNPAFQVKCAAAGPSRGDAVEQLWDELSEEWQLERGPGLRFQDCPEGVGLFLMTDNPPDLNVSKQLILSIPKDKAIKVKKTDNGPVFENWQPGRRVREALEYKEPVQDEYALLALAIIDCLEGEHGQAWKRYMEISLPPLEEACHPILLPDELLEHLVDAQLLDETRQRKQLLEDIAQELFPDLQRTGSDETPLLFRAMAHAISHARETLEYMDQIPDGFALIPFSEFINHSEIPKGEHLDLPDAYESRSVEVLWKGNLWAGDQFTCSYGTRSNSELFRTYGFSVPETIYDYLVLQPGSVSEAIQTWWRENMPFKINWFYLKALRPEMRRDYIMRVDFLDYFKWNNFREECKIALQDISRDDDFQAWESKVSAKQFEAVALYRRRRKGLIEAVIALLDQRLGP